jgi:hypothetical protein
VLIKTPWEQKPCVQFPQNDCRELFGKFFLEVFPDIKKIKCLKLWNVPK